MTDCFTTHAEKDVYKNLRLTMIFYLVKTNLRHNVIFHFKMQNERSLVFLCLNSLIWLLSWFFARYVWVAKFSFTNESTLCLHAYIIATTCKLLKSFLVWNLITERDRYASSKFLILADFHKKTITQIQEKMTHRWFICVQQCGMNQKKKWNRY